MRGRGGRTGLDSCQARIKMSQIFYSSILASSLSPSDLGHFKQILQKINKAYDKKDIFIVIQFLYKLII